MKKLLLIFTFLLFIFSFQIVEARGFFGRFFHGLRNVTHFVVSVPDKLTRPLGPVIGPIASAVLTQNISAHNHLGHIFQRARQINNFSNNVKEQERITREIREMYRNQAKDLRDYAKDLNLSKEKLRQALQERNISMRDYIETVVNVDLLIESVNESADRFEYRANHLSNADVIKMAGSHLAQNVLGEIKSSSLSEINGALRGLLNPYIIDILKSDEGALDTLIDLALNKDKTSKNKFDFDDLKNRVRERIKEVLANNQKNFDKSFNVVLDEIIKETENEIIKERGAFDEKTDELKNNLEQEKPQSPYSEDELAPSLDKIPKDEHGCAPGYVWRRMSGVGCVQKDCYDVGAHYSYTQACICGLNNPKPGDKTKSCIRPANYISCPSCVYACVAPDEECPER